MTGSDYPHPSSFIFHPFSGGKRYAALGPALRALFGGRTRRIPLDAGFTCPTRDGSLGILGCLYCDEAGARPAYVKPQLPVREQLAQGIARSLERDPKTTRFIAYFQAYTSTYLGPEFLAKTGDPTDRTDLTDPTCPTGPTRPTSPMDLRATYEDGLSDPRVVAMAIGARPDCLPEPILDVLSEFGRRTFLWVEIGLQSTRNATLAAVGRGHTVEQFIAACQRLKASGIRFCAHVIFGLPGDSRDDMLAAADLLNRLGAWGVKMHNLYIDKHSPLAEPYLRGEIPILSREEYLDLAVDFLARLSPEILIHRLLGETHPNRLLAPDWSADKASFLNALDRTMTERGILQGCAIQNPAESKT